MRFYLIYQAIRDRPLWSLQEFQTLTYELFLLYSGEWLNFEVLKIHQPLFIPKIGVEDVCRYSDYDVLENSFACSRNVKALGCSVKPSNINVLSFCCSQRL